MPLHTHRCLKCEEITKVMRSIGEHSEPPTEEEQECECKDPEWKKVLTGAPSASYATSWAGGGGGKGNW